jgi:hypothetical protein
LDDLRAWPLVEADDTAGLHRGALKALLAAEELAGLELPVEVCAPLVSDAAAVEQWEVITRLLAQAEGVLRGATHREHVDRLCRVLPGHGVQLLRKGMHAADRLRALRARVDFVCDGQGLALEAIEPMHPVSSPLPQ